MSRQEHFTRIMEDLAMEITSMSTQESRMLTGVIEALRHITEAAQHHKAYLAMLGSDTSIDSSHKQWLRDRYIFKAMDALT